MNQAQEIQAFDLPFCDEPDDDVINELVSMSAYDSFELARAKMHVAVLNLSLATIGSYDYSKALDEVAQTSAQETQAWEELRLVF